jgi:Tol biopolymer transport system component
LYYYASTSVDEKLVFSSLTRNADIWSLPIDATHGKVKGELKQLTHDAADDLSPSLSADGKRMVFESNRTGKRVVWIKDLETGKEKALSDTPSSENLPIISADGTEVVYFITHWPNDSGELYVTPFEGGPAKKLPAAGGAPNQWSSDRSKILVLDAEENQLAHIAWLDVATGRRVSLLRHPKYPIWAARLSPDESWACFTAELRPGQLQSFMAPVHDDLPPPESTWISIDCGRWSPDGSVLYFISERDGFHCLYAQRFDPKAKRPVGVALPAHHFHKTRRSVIEDPAWRGVSVAEDKVAITLVDLTGNIWMAEAQGR